MTNMIECDYFFISLLNIGKSMKMKVWREREKYLIVINHIVLLSLQFPYPIPVVAAYSNIQHSQKMVICILPIFYTWNFDLI